MAFTTPARILSKLACRGTFASVKISDWCLPVSTQRGLLKHKGYFPVCGGPKGDHMLSFSLSGCFAGPQQVALESLESESWLRVESLQTPKRMKGLNDGGRFWAVAREHSNG